MGTLTPRQQEVIRLLARGLTNKEIAQQLGISSEGVKAHVSRLLLRAGVRNRAALVHSLMPRTATADEVLRADARAQMGQIVGDLQDRVSGDGGDGAGRPDRLGHLIDSLASTAPADLVRGLRELRESLGAIDLAVELAAKLPPDRSNDVLLGAIKERARKALEVSIALDEELSRALFRPMSGSTRFRALAGRRSPQRRVSTRRRHS